MKKLILSFVLVMVAVIAQPSFAAPRLLHCRSGYTRQHVRIPVRRHHRLRWVRAWRCERKQPVVKVVSTLPVRPPAPTPVVHYLTKVDPSFTQAMDDPLAVTYSYSADATVTTGTETIDLAGVGQLPAGILNFYSQQQSGGPESLYCSVNVGSAVTSSTCPILYDAPGTYQVTTQYIPNAAAATTQTDSETISPFSTTTTLTVTESGCHLDGPPGYTTVKGPYCQYTVTNSVVDQNGNEVGGQVLLEFAPDTGEAASGSLVSANGSCSTYVTSSWVLSPDCNFEAGSGLYNAAAWSATVAYGGTTGWTPSQSVVQTVTP